MDESTKPAQPKVQPYAWLILVIVFLASFVAPMAQFKVTTLSSWLLPAFGMDMATFGWLMSSLTICGVLLAFPAAWICGKLGLKNAILISTAFIGVGSLLGALTDSIQLLFVSRALEGCGIAFIGVSAPTALSVWFPEGRRALPLAIWCTWMPLGTTVMLLVAPPIAEALGFKAVWWVCVLAAVIAFLLVLALFKMPKDYTIEESETQRKGFFKEGLKYLKNKEIWLLVVLFFCFNFVCNGVFMSYYPAYMEQAMGFTPAEAGGTTSVMAILTIVIMPIMGAVYDFLKKRKVFVFAALAFCTVAVGFAFQESSVAMVWACVIVFGIAGGLVASGTRPMTPEIMEKHGIGALGIAMGMGAMQVAQNLGPTIGAPLFGSFVDSIGWFSAGLFCVPVLLVAVVCLVFIKVK